jgi:hypothetical protein
MTELELTPVRKWFTLVDMSRSRIAAALWVLVAVHVTVAGLPHTHAGEAVHVGDVPLGHSGVAGDGSCIQPPLELAAASTCLVCALHAQQMAPSSGAAGTVVVPTTSRVVGVHAIRHDPPQPWSVPVRGPPHSV